MIYILFYAIISSTVVLLCLNVTPALHEQLHLFAAD